MTITHAVPCTSAHPVHDDGLIRFCMVCHFRTDYTFAMYSIQLLARIKAGA